MIDESKTKPRFQTNIKAEREQFIHQAAEATGFDMVVHKAYGNCPSSNYISVWTNEPLSRDHKPFWQEYERLRDSE